MSNSRRSRTASTTDASTDTAGDGGQVWTAEKIRALGASTDLTTAARGSPITMKFLMWSKTPLATLTPLDPVGIQIPRAESLTGSDANREWSPW